MFTEYSTTRLKLRLVNPESMEYIFSHPDEEIKNLMGLVSEEDLQKWKKRYYGGLTTNNKSYEYFFLVLPKTGEVIGWAGFHTWYLDHNRAELGYWIYQDQYKEQGFISEALNFTLDYGFQQMNLHRIEAFVAPYNEASNAVMKKYNFTREGLLREHYFYNGKMDDSIVYSLLRSEYSI